MPASVALIAGNLEGQPASIDLPGLTGLQRRSRQVVLLPPARQQLGGESSFEYQGGELPLPGDLSLRIRRLVEPLVEKLVERPGFRGYCGIDVVLGKRADGGADRIIELNCRLTTSYLGLKALSTGNLAALLLAAAQRQAPVVPAWRNGVVYFDAAGGTTFLPARAPGCRTTPQGSGQDLPLEA
jgi:predicted ATP-grasp superfamily ATP-dependent carboligase